MEKINLGQKFAELNEHWQPKIVGELNGQEIKLVKLKGTFVWHRHDVEEMFLVFRNTLRIEFRDQVVELEPGEFLIVPRGIEHRSVADVEAEVLLFEPKGTSHTGSVTAPKLMVPTGE